jgi:predicted DCC family thiol-disulfide oxidoreductase YuxK
MTDEPASDADADRDPEAVVDDLDQPVLLFDGVCNLCNGFVRFVVRFDSAGRYLFAPLQSDVGRELLDRLDMPTESIETVVLVDEESVSTKSTAALRVLRELDGPWPLLSPLVVLPTGLRDRVYDLVATHRYRVFGRTDECQVPDPEIRERFLERSLARL